MENTKNNGLNNGLNNSLNNGFLGVCYYPEHWSVEKWLADVKIMQDLGLEWVRIGEFAWSRLERKRNDFNIKWLREILDLFHEKNMKVIFGTPTATPPKWLIDQHPDILSVDQWGQVRQFGSRRHYCFSSLRYREEVKRLLNFLLKEIGSHPAIKMWQTDNEYGCHDTTLSYSCDAKKGFRKWLKEKYREIHPLNEAWGNVFWSMEYHDFDEIELPNLTVTEANPAHQLDFQRFSSDQVISFNKIQVDLIREHQSEAKITHNFMGFSFDFNHFKICKDLSLASWDSYPLGYLQNFVEDAKHKKKYLRKGEPDFQAFYHDLYRNLNGDFAIMEHQPGAVNWAKYNLSPTGKTLRLWVWEALAHGASFVNFFRFRQVPFGQEQMHEGLLFSNNEPNKSYHVVQEVAAEIKKVKLAKREHLAEVGIVFDYESHWIWKIQPQGENLNYFDLLFSWYQALRKKGINVDFIHPDFSNYRGHKLLIVSGLTKIDPRGLEVLKDLACPVIIGPRTGNKTENFQIPPNLLLEELQALLGIRVQGVETLPPGEEVSILREENAAFTRWREFIKVSDSKTPEASAVKISLKTFDDYPAFVERGRFGYLAGIPNAALLEKILLKYLEKSNLTPLPLPDAVRLVKDKERSYFTNYGNKTQNLRHLLGSAKILLGSEEVQESEITIVETI